MNSDSDSDFTLDACITGELLAIAFAAFIVARLWSEHPVWAVAGAVVLVYAVIVWLRWRRRAASESEEHNEAENADPAD